MKEPIKNLIETLEKKIGKFTYKLIYLNNEEKNFVYLLKSKKGKFVLKMMIKFEEKHFDNEIKQRKNLSEMLKKSGIKNCVITEIVDYNKKQRWTLAKYEKFETLYGIYSKNKKKFRQIILEIYSEFFPKLLKQYSLRKKLASEFSLQDLGYYNGKIYFYDLEANKEIGKQYVDLYAKLCKQYFRAIGKNSRDKKFIEDLLFEIQKRNKINKNYLNKTLLKRLESKVFKKFTKQKYYNKKLLEKLRFKRLDNVKNLNFLK